MRNLLSPFFLACVMIYLAIKIAQQAQVKLPGVIQNYGADMLCMPIVFWLILVIVRKFKKNNALYLSVSVVLFVFIYWSVYFEYYLPSKNAMYTGDIVDVLMYAFGSGIFLIWQKFNSTTVIRKPDYQ